MPKRQRVDSATAAVRIMAAASSTLDPPEHISVPAGSRPFWDAIVRGRARADWLASPSLMNAAANLAWTQWRIDLCRRLIDGSDDDREGVAVAQLASQLLKMQRLEMGYLRVLQQHGRGVDGEARDASKRNTIARGIEDDSPFEDDDLLARPEGIVQ